MKKLLLKILLVLMTFATAFSLVACSCDSTGDNGDGGGTTPPPPPKVESLIATKTTFNMVVGDLDYFSVGGYEEVEGVSLVYTTSDPNVAAISQSGEVEAMGEGQATITATYGEQSITAKVYSSFGVSVPELVIYGPYVANLSTNEPYNINAQIRFNKKLFGKDRGVTFTYESSNTNVATVDANGVVTGVNGVDDYVNITVTAFWRGFDGTVTKSMQKVVQFNVSTNVTFLVNDETATGYTVYSVPTWGGVSYNNSIPFVYTAKYGDEEIPNADITATVLDDSMATLENNVLTGKSYGTTGATSVLLSFTKNGKPFSKVISISIERPIANYAQKLPYFSTYYGYFKDPNNKYANTKLADALFDGDELVDVFQNGNKLTIKDGYILGVEGNYDCVANTTLLVGSDKGYYYVDIDAYTHVIQTEEDLLVFDIDNKNKRVIGYCEVINDIDASSIMFFHGNTKRSDGYYTWGDGPAYVYTGNDGSTGFSGVFEGNGYVIKNLNMNYNKVLGGKGNKSQLQTARRGIFGCIFAYEGNYPIIRNIAFDNVDVTQCNLIANSIISRTKLENIFIRTTEDTLTAKGDIVYSYSDGCLDMNNVVIEQRGIQTFRKAEDLNGTGAFFADATYLTSSGLERIKNTYLISEHYISSHFTSTTVEDEDGNLLYPIKYVAYGANETATWDGDTIPPNDTAKGDVRVNDSVRLPIYRYETYDAMVEANHDLSSFAEGDYWVTLDGYPIWRRLAEDRVFVSQAGVPKYNNLNVVFTINKTSEEFGLVNTMGDDVAITSVESASPSIVRVALSDDMMTATATLRDGYEFKDPKTVTIKINYLYNNIAGTHKVNIFMQPEIETVDTEVTYSAYNGKFYDPNNTIPDLTNLTAAFQVFEDGTMSSLSLSSTGDIFGGTIKIKDDFSDVEYITLRLATADVVYEFTKVKAYSGILTKGTDLKWFELTNIDTVVEGYYIVANNINANGVVIEHYNTGDPEQDNYQYREMPTNMTGKFQGVFDGMGYSIDDMFAFRNGLFGRIESNETYTTHIRNIGFTNLDTDSNQRVSRTLAGSLLANFAPYSTNPEKYVTQISNLYVHLKPLPDAIAQGPTVLGMFNKGNSELTHKFTDCYFDYESFYRYYTAYMNWGLLNTGIIYRTDPAWNNPDKNDRFDNIFVASTMPLQITRGSMNNPEILEKYGVKKSVAEAMPNSNFRITYAKNRIGKTGFSGISWVSNEYANANGTHNFYSLGTSIKYTDPETNTQITKGYTNYYDFKLYHEVITEQNVETGCMIYENVWQYDTVAEMKAAVAADNTLLANFDTSETGFWKIEDNELMWKSASSITLDRLPGGGIQ